MEVPFNDIFHLELFRMGDEDFIKDTHNPSMGNAMRRSGKKDYVFLPPETLVQRLIQKKESTSPISKAEYLVAP